MEELFNCYPYRWVEGYEGLYAVSSAGELYSYKHSKTNPVKIYAAYASSGKLVVKLYKDGKGLQKSLHVLVAKAFIPNPNNRKYVVHLDGDVENNAVSNLAWCKSTVSKVYDIHVNKIK